MINALIVSASLPPFNDSSTLQLLARVRGFARHNIKPTFIGSEVLTGHDRELTNRLPPDCRIVRTAPAFYDRVMHQVAQMPFSRLLTWSLSNAMYRFLAPDLRAGWDKQVVDLYDRLDHADEQHVVVSSGGSVTAHLAGKVLSRTLRIPWIADMGDPWSLVDPTTWAFAWKSRRNRTLEAETLPAASGIVFTTEATRAAYKTLFRDSLPASIALPCYGFDIADFRPPQTPPSNEIVLSHIGAAHSANRDLAPTIEAIARLNNSGSAQRKFKFNVIGPHSQSFEKLAERLDPTAVTFSPRVSFEESIKWINRSTVLLVVGNASRLQIPGKIYPALGSGRPMLYLGQLPRQEDPTARLCEQYDGIRFAGNNADSVYSALLEIDRDCEKLTLASALRQSSGELSKYRNDIIADQFANFVLSICAQYTKGNYAT